MYFSLLKEKYKLNFFIAILFVQKDPLSRNAACAIKIVPNVHKFETLCIFLFYCSLVQCCQYVFFFYFIFFLITKEQKELNQCEEF